jgi:hypothetical protein
MNKRKMMNYGMFTDAGNDAVAQVVEMAKTTGISWNTVSAMLYAVADNNEVYSEASDTAVREAVYLELYGADV